jgi:malonate-semialdehyde dehydrogenase (acetylating)/methylmalonate-semialdehyde dehydrogenase
VVEHACSIGTLQLGEFAENVAGGVDTYTLRQPIGVCAGITPFNFPAMIPLWMFPMAIVCGNTFVLKPSEQDPLSTMELVELAIEAGVPAGVLNVVHGGKEWSTRSARIRTSRRSRSSARPPSARTCTTSAASTASACSR